MKNTVTHGRGDSAAQHTPGPWYILGEYVSSKSGGEIICPIKRIRAEDQRLIAAAPEILDALRGMIGAYSGDRDMSAEDCVAAYNRALAIVQKIDEREAA